MKKPSYLPRTAFLAVVLFLVPQAVLSQQADDYKYTPPVQLNDGIKTGTLRAAKIDEAKIVAGTNEILKGTFPNMHSLLIFRHNKLVYENYFTGEDVERGVGPLGVVNHTRDTLHDMRSVSKSIVATAVLLAHSQGKIKSLDDPIFDYFPEYSKYADGDKKGITIKHVLSMTAGFEWDEKISYADPKNSEIQMNNAVDAVDFVLKQKLVEKPGTVFNYSGGCTQLLVALIKKATGSDADVFTEKHLFGPLGITKYKWVKTKSGDPSGASGLRLRSRDMAKIGLLMMQRGKWNGKQVLSENLVDLALTEHISIVKEGDFEMGYGFQIWLPSFDVGGVRISLKEFSGNGGQLVQIDKANGLMIAATAGNYNNRGPLKTGRDLVEEFVYPARLDKKTVKQDQKKP